MISEPVNINYQQFFYGTDQERRKVITYENSNLVKTKYYSTNYEKINYPDGSTKEVNYIPGGDGLAAVYIKENGSENMYYTYTDYLGSILAITDASGSVVEERSYYAWGRERNPYDWTYNLSSTEHLIDRGYTCHEHIPQFNLINMNGRMYDPVIGRFLSPDNYVQNPENPQGYNRYSYCLNNPLVYVDLDGEIIWVPIMFAAIAGAGMNLIFNDPGSFLEGLGYIGIGALAGAASVGTGYYASSLVSALGFIPGFITGFSSGFTGGFVLGAGNEWYRGSSFSQGLKSGFNQGMISGTISGIIGGVSGGISSIKHGGDFFIGKGMTFKTRISDVPAFENGEPVNYSTEDAIKFRDEYNIKIPKSAKVKGFYADGSFPPGSTAEDFADALGATINRGFGRTDIYLFERAFTAKERLFIVMQHEYLHAGFTGMGIGYSSKTKQELSAHMYNYHQATPWNFEVEQNYFNLIDYQALNKITILPEKYHYSKLGILILNKTPW